MSPFKIRGCSGLGDAVYNYAVCKYYKERGNDVLVETKYPEIFNSLGIKTTSERIFDPNVNCSYVPFKADKRTNQFQDALTAAKISANIDMSIDWGFYASGGTTRIEYLHSKSEKRWMPICVIADLYKSSGIRSRDNLIPNREVYQSIVSAISKNYFTVLVGLGQSIITGCDLDIKNNTSIRDLIWITKNSAIALTQVGALLPIAEASGKPVISILSKEYALSGDPFLNTITPKKVKCSPKSLVIYDDTKNICDVCEKYADENA